MSEHKDFINQRATDDVIKEILASKKYSSYRVLDETSIITMEFIGTRLNIILKDKDSGIIEDIRYG